MGSTLLQVYRQMEASMQDATKKMVSLTYMPVSKRYLPWQVNNHGTDMKSRRSVHNTLKKNLFSTIQVHKLKNSWDEKSKVLKKIDNFKAIKWPFDSPFVPFMLRAKVVEKKEQTFPPKNWTVQIGSKSSGNPQFKLALFCDCF